MSIIRLPIDTKSLYFNIKNDNKTGHTATVATPLKQGASIRPELSRIGEIPENIGYASKENLISKILSKSRAEAKINGVYVFDKISVNGNLIDTPSSFCIYIREETDPKNFHFGRQKLHYPPSLIFEDLDVDINNRKVVNKISEHLHGYAFLVEAFEYSTDTQILNFDAVIVGEPDIPYSKVFINRRGVGNKFTSLFTENSNIYDAEIISLREKLGYDAVGPENFEMVMAENKKIAITAATNYLKKSNATNIRVLEDEYPYSIYDISYSLNGEKRYLIVKYTATKSKYFNLPISKIQFCNNFAEQASVVLLTNINETPVLHLYTISDLNSMNKSINSITYEDRS